MSFRSEQDSASPLPKKSWADMNDDDDDGFSFPVLSLKPFDNDEGESDSVAATDAEEEGAAHHTAAGTPMRSTAGHATNQGATVPAKLPTTGTGAKPMAPQKEMDPRSSRPHSLQHPSPCRALLPQFVELTVDSTIPYHLISSMSGAVGVDCVGESDEVDWSAIFSTQEVLDVLASSEKSSVTDSRTPTKRARADARRSKAVRLLEETLSVATEPIPCDDLARSVNWNRKFRPAVGCLFSFLKKHRELFAYSRGSVALYANDAAMQKM